MINLKKDELKKEKIKQELAKYALDYEIVEAINGSELSDIELESLVKDYKNCHLTKGEIGCALSHQMIYKKMIKDDIHHCLILEDDVEIKPQICSLISDMDEFLVNKKRFICLAYKTKKIFNFVRYKTKSGFRISESYQASRAHGYFITKDAAKTILKINFPIILEADMFGVFFRFGLLRTYCINEDIINTNDMSTQNSNIENERAKVSLLRRKYRKKLAVKSFISWLIICYEKLIKRGVIGIKRNRGKNI